MEELVPYMRGWCGYFGFCETPEVLIALTRWVRLRLRAALWRQWKTPRRRRAALIALRVSGELRNTAGSDRGPWNIARSKALSLGLSNAYFKLLGLPTLVETRWRNFSNRRIRTRTHGGVGGAEPKGSALSRSPCAKRTFVESTVALSAGCSRLSDINLVAFRGLLGDAENAQILLHAFELEDI
jgi:hypothetical protein